MHTVCEVYIRSTLERIAGFIAVVSIEPLFYSRALGVVWTLTGYTTVYGVDYHQRENQL